jgi:glycosyltransferase involved in cell wall biosynthesis
MSGHYHKALLENRMPKVSICIPTYNQAAYLKKTIDSVLAQTFNDYEIIITDDSPNDSVKDLVSSFSRKDVIKYFKNPVQLGSPENWNESIRKANGEYIKILHHDDWFYDNRSLAKYVAMLGKSQNVDFAFSATKACSALNGDYVHSPTPEQLKNLGKEPTVLYCNNFVGAPSNTIFRNKKNFLFDKNIKWLVDIDFYIRMLQHNGNFAFTEEVLSVTNLPEGRVSDHCANNKQVELFEYFYVLDKLRHVKSKTPKESYFQLILEAIRICKKYSTFNKIEIRQSGYTGAIPLAVITYFKLYKASKLSARAYLKILRTKQ